MIDPAFRNINRFFVISFKIGDDHPTRYCFDQYYMNSVEIKDFKALLDTKPFFDQPVKNKQKVHRRHIEISRDHDYSRRNLLDSSYYLIYYKRFGIDLSRQKYTSIPQQNNFTGKLEDDDWNIIVIK